MPAEGDRLAEGGQSPPVWWRARGFLREWSGFTHVVEPVKAVYRWARRVFASLSATAKEISGAHWLGLRFFGVTAGSKAGRGFGCHGAVGKEGAKP